MRKPKEPVKPSNVFVCTTCQQTDGMTPEQTKEHLQSVHKVSSFKGTKTLLFHVDCQDSYTSQYEWDVQGVKLTQWVTNPRKIRF